MNDFTSKLLRESGGGVIVQPENPAALIEGLKELMRDKKVREEMGARNRSYAVEHFDRKKVLQAQETFLTDVVG